METYDVVILGGGLAGLTLSLQLKKQRPETNILVLEMRPESAPEAAHKVGESTVELGTYYLREVLGLKDYLIENQLPKEGLRYFFSPKNKSELSERLELGPLYSPTHPSHQVDRGVLENDLIHISREVGNTVRLGAKVSGVELCEDVEELDEPHKVTYYVGDEQKTVETRWVADSTGRASFLKRKLKFQEDLDHGICSAWFRVDEAVDIDDWSENKEWKAKIKPGLRRLATNHLMDQGYWVWIIPLVNGKTSIGIVADPEFHPFEEYNTYEKAMKWLQKNEPVAYENLRDHEPLDFLVLRHFAHGSGKFYSNNRWGVTGEAGAFLDPFYSPGTDFIALNNTFLGDLIIRELGGEDIYTRSAVYEQTHKALFENWVPVYQHQYRLMDNTQIMLAKISWDWAIYWAVPALMFTNNGYINIAALKKLFGTEEGYGKKSGTLNGIMQKFFSDWYDYDKGYLSNNYYDIFNIVFIKKLHEEMLEQYDTDGLIAKVEENMHLMEQVATELFRLASHSAHGTPLDMKVDPYQMDLKDPMKGSENGRPSDPKIMEDVQRMWYYPIEETA